jgi:phosphoserine aminotransferase
MSNWHGTGLSVLEMSHRGKHFDSIQQKTRADLKQLMCIPDDFEILFFQGGASQQFSGMCHNLLGEGVNQSAYFLTTGLWS